MKTTQNLEMKIPEGGDPIDITDITGNFEKLDTEIAKKASSSGGDISAMAVKTLDTIAAEFPVPSAGESSKTFLGKVRKFVQDFNNFKTGILTLGRLVNNGQTTEPGFALDARYGRTLYELYAQLNADLGNLNSNLSVMGTDYSISPPSYVSCETGITTEIVGIVLPSGTYVISAGLKWSDAARGGGRRIHIRQGEYYNSLSIASDGSDDFANDVAPMEQSTTGIAVLPTGSYIKLWATQTSGSNLSVESTAYLKAARIK